LRRVQCSEPLNTKKPPTFCFFGTRFGLYRILSSYWLAHFFLLKNPPKCCTILVLIAVC
jgi:hypothetical protein